MRACPEALIGIFWILNFIVLGLKIEDKDTIAGKQCLDLGTFFKQAYRNKARKLF